MFYCLEVVVVAHLLACFTKSDLGTLGGMFRLCMKVSLLWTKLLISLQGDVSIGTSRITDHTKGYTWKSYIRKVLGNTGTHYTSCAASLHQQRDYSKCHSDHCSSLRMLT